MTAFEFLEPALCDLIDRYRIDEVQLFAALPLPGDKICLLKHPQVFGNGLACHVEPVAKLAQRLAIPLVQPVEQVSPACISQSMEHSVVIIAHNTEPFGYLIYATHRLPVKSAQIIGLPQEIFPIGV